MNALLLEFLGAVARWLLTALGTWFVAKHILTGDQVARFSTALLQDLALWAPVVAGLLWSLWAKYRGRVKFLTALSLPSGANETEVKAAIANGAGASLSPHP